MGSQASHTPGPTRRARHSPSRGHLIAGAASLLGASILTVSLLSATAQADETEGGSAAASLREYIRDQVGGLKNLQVPARNEDIPLPRQADGTVNPRYATTEAKRFLGKLLFHDPVRTARIDINTGQPVDLPAGTAFGGTVSASDPSIQAIINATKQTGSCGSCHIGEAAGKAGQVLNFNVGGEGRGYTDEQGLLPTPPAAVDPDQAARRADIPGRRVGRCAPDVD